MNGFKFLRHIGYTIAALALALGVAAAPAAAQYPAGSSPHTKTFRVEYCRANYGGPYYPDLLTERAFRAYDNFTYYETRRLTGAWVPTTELKSNETRCLSDGYTVRVYFWNVDFYVGPGPRPNRTGCKFYADTQWTINGAALTGQIVPIWCGGF